MIMTKQEFLVSANIREQTLEFWLERRWLIEPDLSKKERSVVAGFELQGVAEAGRLNLSTPTGQVMAQARWQPGRVVLVTPQGETPYASLDALTREVLGESLPVAALFDWLHGRPWPGAGHVAQPPGFR